MIGTVEVNRDSAKADSCCCGLWDRFVDPLYARGRFFIQFGVPAVRLATAPPDTILEVGWQAIDTAYPQMRADFAALENRFGTILLRKAYPHVSDTGDYYSQYFWLWFGNYNHLDTLNAALAGISDIGATFVSYPYSDIDGVSDDKILEETHLSLFPNPTNGRLCVMLPNPCAKSLRLYDHKGKEVGRYAVEQGITDLTLELDPSLPNGVYYINGCSTFHHILLLR